MATVIKGNTKNSGITADLSQIEKKMLLTKSIEVYFRMVKYLFSRTYFLVKPQKKADKLGSTTQHFVSRTVVQCGRKVSPQLSLLPLSHNTALPSKMLSLRLPAALYATICYQRAWKEASKTTQLSLQEVLKRTCMLGTGGKLPQLVQSQNVIRIG